MRDARSFFFWVFNSCFLNDGCCKSHVSN
jgi:hypothetical protein